MKNKTILMIMLFIICIFLVAKMIWWTNFVSWFLALSLPIIFILWKIKWRNRIFAIIAWLFIMWIDFFLLVLMIVPTNSYNIETRKYYKNKENYMKIYIKDKKEDLAWMAIMIKKDWETKRNATKLTEYEKWNKITIEEKDKIYFMWQKKFKSYAVIYLWDDSILRITPWTKLSMEKLTKNLDNMASNETNIKLEHWNIWFRVLKMVKTSKNMNIDTWKWQTLIIRWTAGLVSIDEEKTYAFDYDHFIEVKNQKNSTILKEWEWAILSWENIETTDNIWNLLKQVWINENLVKEFKIADDLDMKTMKDNIINYINKEVASFGWNKLFWQLEAMKLKIYSIWNKTYQKYLWNLADYKYLIGEWEKFTKNLIWNENLAFMASALEKQKVKTAYLANEIKNNITNSDIYKTYVINLWIEGKIKDVNEEIMKNIWRLKDDPEGLLKDIDMWIDNININLNNLLNF